MGENNKYAKLGSSNVSCVSSSNFEMKAKQGRVFLGFFVVVFVCAEFGRSIVCLFFDFVFVVYMYMHSFFFFFSRDKHHCFTVPLHVRA